MCWPLRRSRQYQRGMLQSGKFAAHSKCIQPATQLIGVTQRLGARSIKVSIRVNSYPLRNSCENASLCGLHKSALVIPVKTNNPIIEALHVTLPYGLWSSLGVLTGLVDKGTICAKVSLEPLLPARQPPGEAAVLKVQSS